MEADEKKLKIEKGIKQQLWNIVRVLHGGDRVEIIPTKDGVKVLKVNRHEIKENSPR